MEKAITQDKSKVEQQFKRGEYIGQGMHTDIKQLLVAHNCDINSIKNDLDSADLYCKYKNGIEALCEHMTETKHVHVIPTTVWLAGPTGVGKSLIP